MAWRRWDLWLFFGLGVAFTLWAQDTLTGLAEGVLVYGAVRLAV
jgi:hypothetical protein